MEFFRLELDKIKISINKDHTYNLKPNVLIPGAGRAGTSILYNCLKNHPQIFFSSDKEPSYFSLYYDLGNDWYLRNFRAFKEYPVVGEASTQYFYIKKAVKRIYDFNPDFKLIFILRNPVIRAYSNYKREIQMWGENRSFEEIIEVDKRYLYASTYYPYLVRFFRYFPKKQIKIIIFENFIKNIHKYLEELCVFLNVNPKYNFNINKLDQNPSKMPINLKLQTLNKKIFYFNRRESFILQTFRMIGRSTINSINHICYKSRKFPSINNKTRKLLKDYFYEDIIKLEELIGEDLSIWK